MRKKLIVKQVDECDCGVCCLLSIIRYFKGNVPLELLKIDTNTSRLGTNAYELIKAAEKYGLEGKGIKVQKIDDLFFPAIAHLKISEDFYHFVVIYNIKDDKIILMDPAKGKVKITKENFYKSFTGNILLFDKVTEITYLESNPTLKNIIKLFLKNNQKNIINLYFIEICLLLITLINAFNLKLIANNIKLFSCIFISSIILESIIIYKRNKILTQLKKLFSLNLTKNFFSHLLLIPLKFIQLKSNGEIITRFKELEMISNFIINLLFKNVLEIIICTFIFIIISIIMPNITLLLILISIIILVINQLLLKYIQPKINEEINNEVNYNTKLNEYINSLETIKNLNNYLYFSKEFNLNLSNKIIHSIKLEKKILNAEVLKEFIFSFVYLLLIIYSLYLKEPIINIITLLNLINIFFDSFKSLLNDLPVFTYQKSIFIKLNEYMSITEEEILKNSIDIKTSITFDNVGYTYNNLNNIKYNFYIKENSFVMIKGKNGSGKSTICKLLAKNLTNYTGSILIGGKNIADYTESEIRGLISYSNQSAKIFKDTIINNITLNQKFDQNEFTKIAKICDLESVVSKKTNRYNSLIYENNPNFSGGEIQKIILARTLLKKSKIIILDETLSGVSIQDEIKIIKLMKQNISNKTIIYITHKNLEKYFDECIELERN